MFFKKVFLKDSSGLKEGKSFFIISKWQTSIPNFSESTSIHSVNPGWMILPPKAPKKLIVCF